ncbi:hypothetical protein K504DRAFT_241775 [Pleomassaria siparia CBS 279.74]|uniref:Uncharacterized protein n=1 Tax=Pleomassaria siparia CBS 279.74 TaxID=1314801 RepID=A0A6G1KDW3_9PLEO|nr:hypothetical protein K504DRAFT_241775 [Pleomassaria siparia CBS 279.74]
MLACSLDMHRVQILIRVLSTPASARLADKPRNGLACLVKGCQRAGCGARCGGFPPNFPPLPPPPIRSRARCRCQRRRLRLLRGCQTPAEGRRFISRDQNCCPAARRHGDGGVPSMTITWSGEGVCDSTTYIQRCSGYQECGKMG